MEKDLLELTTHCIRCGFCLESCPTFKLTGEETESPRGRIYLVRGAVEGKLRFGDDVKPHLDSCLGCRNCETACPSGVEYGAIFEIARDRIESEKPQPLKRFLVESLTRPAVLRLQLALGKLVPGHKVPKFLGRALGARGETEANLPTAQTYSWPPMDDVVLPERGRVVMLEGCVMSVLFEPVNQATRRLLRRAGYEVIGTRSQCCGALHAHNGYLQRAASLGNSLRQSLPPDIPFVVNSAGCGSTIKEYSPEFANRTVDLSEILCEEGFLSLLSAKGTRLTGKTITYHDACHLAHGQKVTGPPRNLLAAIPGVTLAPLDESDMCCGSAGIYNILQPANARKLLDRKWENIKKTGADIVATGNPGCHAWIEQMSRETGGSVQVLHTAELIEAAFSGLPR